MKKNYFLLLFLCINYFGFSQGAEFTIDFEGADPLNSLPAGITSVNPQDFYETPEAPGVFSDSIVAYIANNSYYFITEGGDYERAELFTERNQFDNVIKDVDGNKLLQTDYTGHVVIDETALGTSSYSVRLNLAVFGHRMGSTDCGIFTITGNDNGTYKDDRLTARNGGFTTGFGDTGSSGFAYGQSEPPYRDIVITYNDTDKFYRVYIEGVEQILSETMQTSGDWTNRKFYIGFNGQNSVKSTGTSHLDTSTGEFTSNGVRNDGRVADLQMRMDNIQVYKRAISDAEVLTLFNGGTLAVNNVTLESFNAYPNPVKNRLFFSTNDIDSVEIYNLLGSKIASQKATNNSIDTSFLSKGIYLIKCQNVEGANIATLKIIK